MREIDRLVQSACLKEGLRTRVTVSASPHRGMLGVSAAFRPAAPGRRSYEFYIPTDGLGSEGIANIAERILGYARYIHSPDAAVGNATW